MAVGQPWKMRLLVAMALSITLAACGTSAPAQQGAEAGSEQETVVENTDAGTEADAADEVDGEAADDASASDFVDEPKLGAIASGFADEDGNAIADAEQLKKLFSVTLEGTHYQFPYTPRQLIDNGWEVAAGYESVKDQRVSRNNGIAGIRLAYKGNDDVNIVIAPSNYSEEELSWDECIVSGLYIHPNSSQVQFSSDAGIGSDSTLDEILDITGYRAGHDDKGDMYYVDYFDGVHDPDNKQFAERLATVRVQAADNWTDVKEIGLSLGFNGNNPMVKA